MIKITNLLTQNVELYLNSKCCRKIKLPNKMLALTRASVKVSQMMVRDQRMMVSAVRCFNLSASAANEAMPLPSSEKVCSLDVLILK